MAHNLLDLPYEVLHRILTNIDPSDLARLCCCRALDSFIKSDRLLWKELYLRDFVGHLSLCLMILLMEYRMTHGTRYTVN